MKTKILTSMMIVLSGSFMTATYASDFSYNYIQGAYESVDLDGPDADVFKISGSYELTPNFNIIGEYATGDIDNPLGGSDLDLDEGAVGVAYHTAIASKTDFTANIKVINQNTDLAGDDTGYGLGVGIRHMLTNRVEVDANIDFIDVNDNEDTKLEVGARYYFNNAISTGLAYSTSSENVDTVSGNIRWDF